ncbi:GGDEF domain-containing protein [Pseudonocardia sp. TRM90224]|uniref:GGDEF domain-containing protein n=1 Tax=Pseudonocardia sp. TRM90224 TaxID=2812678 RepID=UPI001E62026F|nr:GGDEF domain-containing protein [Pseudonocardia sp. TRM90224]
MASSASDRPGPPGGRSERTRDSTFGGLPLGAIALVVAVDVVAGVALVIAVVVTVPDGFEPTQIGWTAILTALGLLHVEFGLRIEGYERARRRTPDVVFIDLLSVWTFAASLLLSPLLAAAHVVVVDLYSWWRRGRLRPRYRQLFTVATIVLAALAAGAVARWAGTGTPNGSMPVFASGLAILVYTTINTGLVAGAIAVSSPRPTLATTLGRWDENLLEICGLVLGALVAAAMTLQPLLVLFVLPPLLVLHRSVLVRELAESSRTDPKTGLLNAQAWQADAAQLVRGPLPRGGRRAVLVLDLDHFKAVNDTHGHLVGDHVLAAVAAALRGELRQQDLVGRFGGEEFVVLLGTTPNGEPFPLAVAERIRRRLAALRVEFDAPDGPAALPGLTVSIGAAVQHEDGVDLRSLLQRADAALFAAKSAGRNTVRINAPA